MSINLFCRMCAWKNSCFKQYIILILFNKQNFLIPTTDSLMVPESVYQSISIRIHFDSNPFQFESHVNVRKITNVMIHKMSKSRFDVRKMSKKWKA